MSVLKTTGLSPTTRAIVAAAGVIFVIAGIKAAQAIVVPFLLAGFITIILSGPLRWLRKRGLPQWFAMVVVLLTAILFVMIIAVVVGTSIDQFRGSLPEYQARLQEHSTNLSTQLARYGIDVPESKLTDGFSPSNLLGMAGDLLGQLGGLLTGGFIVLLYVAFMLAEVSSFPAKVSAAFDNPADTLKRITRYTEGANKYMAMKAAISAFTGCVISLMLWVIGVDFPILWGVLAGLLNFVPSIGSIFASVPAVLLAVVQLGLGHAIVVAVAYIVINVLIGSIIEPKLMGQRMGLSTLVVFVSLIFWGWVLGPAGMLLSIPLTMLLKIGLDKREDTQWIATMLS